jgi:alpha-beta hydrolase superfamily lysophospholipase
MIHAIVSSEVKGIKKDLSDDKAPIVVMAHSLGAHIMSNYIWDRQHPPKDTKDKREPIPNLVAMITFGCNIPLFSLSFPIAKPINLPGSGIRKPALKTKAKWLNFLDRDDVLGWPLKPLYKKNLAKLTKTQRRTVAKIEDYEINVGSLAINWNPGAHAKYWTDNDFTKPVAEYLRSVIRAAEA